MKKNGFAEPIDAHDANRVIEPRISIAPTYDSRKTGPRYRVTTTVGRHSAAPESVEDPFITTRIRISLWGALRILFRHRYIEVVVRVSGDRAIIEDVMELDGNYKGDRNSTRRIAFDARVNDALASMN